MWVRLSTLRRWFYEWSDPAEEPRVPVWDTVTFLRGSVCPCDTVTLLRGPVYPRGTITLLRVSCVSTWDSYPAERVLCIHVGHSYPTERVLCIYVGDSYLAEGFCVPTWDIYPAEGFCVPTWETVTLQKGVSVCTHATV